MSDVNPGPSPEKAARTDTAGTTSPGRTTGGDATAAGPERSSPTQGGRTDGDPLRGSRTSGVWVALVAVGVLIVLLVVFTLQNTQQVDLAFLGWEGQVPLSAAILIAAAAGILITALAGSLRILQLRRRVKRVEKSR